MTPWEPEIWKDAARHAARHRWTIIPLAGSLMAALAVPLLQLAGTNVERQAFFVPAGIAAVAGLNVLRIVQRTFDYTTGMRGKPGYIAPDAGRRTSIQELQGTGEGYLCAACGKRSDRILEIKFTSPKTMELRRFAMHGSCEDTAEGQAVIAAEKLLAEQGVDMFTPVETIKGVMEQARRDFREGESG